MVNERYQCFRELLAVHEVISGLESNIEIKTLSKNEGTQRLTNIIRQVLQKAKQNILYITNSNIEYRTSNLGGDSMIDLRNTMATCFEQVAFFFSGLTGPLYTIYKA